jgi:four helix bundle protein
MGARGRGEVAGDQWPVAGKIMTVKQYSDLIAWQKAMDLVEGVYQITDGFPKSEVYGLTSQLRRASVSIPSNIAEGQSRRRREFVHCLEVAHGSLSETETQMEIARRLGYVDQSRLAGFIEKAAEVGRLIHGLSRSIEKLATGHRALATSRI